MMTNRLEVDVDLYREEDDVLIAVTVGHIPEHPQDWWSPGSPSETWIIDAVDAAGNAVELTEYEQDLAVARAVFDDLRKSCVRLADIDDEDKPF